MVVRLNIGKEMKCVRFHNRYLLSADLSADLEAARILPSIFILHLIMDLTIKLLFPLSTKIDSIAECPHSLMGFWS